MCVVYIFYSQVNSSHKRSIYWLVEADECESPMLAAVPSAVLHL